MLDNFIADLQETTQNISDKVYRKFSFGKDKQARLLEAIAGPMSVGRPPIDVVRHIKQFGSKQEKIIARDIERLLQSGKSMTIALDGWFDPITLSALSAAEEGGTDSLITAMEYLSKSLLEKEKAKASIYTKWIMPAVYVAATTVMILILNSELLPTMKAITPGGTSPAIEKFTSVVWFYTFIFPFLVVGVLGGLFYVSRWLANSTSEFRDKIDEISLFSGYRLATGASIVGVFSLLKRFKLPGIKILRILENTGSPYQQKHVFNMRESLREGGGVSEVSALNVGLLDDEYMSLLLLYAEGSEEHIIDSLDKAAKDIQKEIIKRLTRMGNIVWVGLWCWLGFNIVTIFSLMYGSVQQ